MTKFLGGSSVPDVPCDDCKALIARLDETITRLGDTSAEVARLNDLVTRVRAHADRLKFRADGLQAAIDDIVKASKRVKGRWWKQK